MTRPGDTPLATEAPPIVDRLRKVNAQHPDQLEKALEVLNTAILHHGTDGSASPISFFALARTIDHLALIEGQARASSAATKKANRRTAKTSGKRDPNVRRWWPLIIGQYKAFLKEFGAKKPFPSLPDSDSIAKFCMLKTRRTGTHATLFYTSLAALVAYMAEKGMVGGEEFDLLTPGDEIDFAQDVCAVFHDILDHIENEGTWTLENASLSQGVRVRLSFPYAPAELQLLEDYCQAFATDETRSVHFIVYRPMLSDPTRLVKSFLTISAPPPKGSRQRREAVFEHFYWPPPGLQDGAAGQFTAGQIIPLAEGVYLVGGRRDLQEQTRPMKTLMVLALPRWAMLNREARIASLGVSANRKGEHLMSRAALRITPVPDYQHVNSEGEGIKFGTVAITELADDIRRDAAIEQALMRNIEVTEQSARRFPLFSPDDLPAKLANSEAQWVLKACNNRPNKENGWLIAPGCESDGIPVDQVSAVSRMNIAFQNVRGSLGIEPDKAFDFWDACRFGPLANR